MSGARSSPTPLMTSTPLKEGARAQVVGMSPKLTHSPLHQRARITEKYQRTDDDGKVIL